MNADITTIQYYIGCAFLLMGWLTNFSSKPEEKNDQANRILVLLLSGLGIVMILGTALGLSWIDLIIDARRRHF